MKMKKRRNILTICTVAIILMAFSVYLLPEAVKPYFMIISIIALAFFIIIFFAMWRCPHCDRSLGRLDYSATHCKYCGKELYKD